jgi:hypothetical protein
MTLVNHYNAIKTKYDEYQTHLLKNGRLPARDTGIGFWGATPVEETYELFKRIGMHRYRNFLDLGSGDGRIVLLASLFDIQAKGIEFDSELIRIATDIRRNLDIPHFSKTKFLMDDFMNHSLSPYDIIFISPDRPFHRNGMEAKIADELSGKLIVHGWEFHPTSLKKEEEHIINGEKYAIYCK